MVYIPIRIETLLSKMNENRKSQKIPFITIKLKYMTSFTILTDLCHIISMKTAYIYNNMPKKLQQCSIFFHPTNPVHLQVTSHLQVT